MWRLEAIRGHKRAAEEYEPLSVTRRSVPISPVVGQVQHAALDDAAALAPPVGPDRDGRVSMWVMGRNNVPISVAGFRPGGIRNVPGELGS